LKESIRYIKLILNLISHFIHYLKVWRHSVGCAAVLGGIEYIWIQYINIGMNKGKFPLFSQLYYPDANITYF